MKNIILKHPKRVFVIASIVLIGLLALPSLRYRTISRAQSKSGGISASLYYTDPTDQLGKMKLDSSAKMDITTGNIQISGTDIWQGTTPSYIIAVHYTDFNNDESERRFVFIVRSALGNPWIIADMPVKNPSGISDINRTVWFAFDIDKATLQSSSPTIPDSWFAEVTSSTIEIGVADQHQINIVGPGDLPVDEKTLITFFKIGGVLILNP